MRLRQNRRLDGRRATRSRSRVDARGGLQSGVRASQSGPDRGKRRRDSRVAFTREAPELARCRDLAIALGEELCRKAVRRDSFWTWERNAVDPATDNPPLTGFAHGAAGFGLAFYELYAATGRPQFLEFARGAVRLRGRTFRCGTRELARPACSFTTPAFTVAWCNGAPGIALARLRAAALDPARAEAYLGKARSAIETTLAAIDTSLEERHCDTSLCHGLAGLGEVVLIAGQMLDDSGYCERSLAVARTLLRRHTEPADWESGASLGGPNPSLMLGLAGVGYWLLHSTIQFECPRSFYSRHKLRKRHSITRLVLRNDG